MNRALGYLILLYTSKLLLASRKISNFFPGTILFPGKRKGGGEKKIPHVRKGNHLDLLLHSFMNYLLSICNRPDPDLGSGVLAYKVLAVRLLRYIVGVESDKGVSK